jgi:LAO/AO transport system kinase
MIGNLYEPAAFAEQTAELAQRIDDHYSYLRQSGQLSLRIERRAMVEINDALRACVLEPILDNLKASGELRLIAEKVKNCEVDPYSIAEEISRRFLK